MGIGDGLVKALGGTPAEEAEKTRNHLRASRIMGEIALEESLSRLELANEDAGWYKAGHEMDREFTRSGLDQIIDMSRAMYLSNPLIQRAVNVATFYTWSQGCTFVASDDIIKKEIIEPMVNDIGNKAELYSHQSQILTDVDLVTEGNLFLACFTNMKGDVQIRSFPTSEIREIHHLNGDSRRPMLYRRCWSEVEFDMSSGQQKVVQKEELYPDWTFYPKKQPASIGGVKVNWDAPIIHQRVGGLKSMQFGVPETYAALDWARAYKKFLENWHSLVASLSKFAWRITTKGSKIKAAKEKLRSTTGEDTSDPFKDDVDFTPGGAFVGKKGDDIEAIPKTGAHTSAEDARSSRLMIASAMNIPDTILSGDVDVGNFATSKTLDRPTELFMINRQSIWADTHQSIFLYKMMAKVRAGRNKIKGKERFEKVGSMRLSVIEFDMDTDIKIAFPPILEDDPKDRVQALVAAATLEGRQRAQTIPREELSRQLMSALEIEDIDTAINELGKEEQEELTKLTAELDELRKNVPKADPSGEQNDPSKTEPKKEGE